MLLRCGPRVGRKWGSDRVNGGGVVRGLDIHEDMFVSIARNLSVREAMDSA